MAMGICLSVLMFACGPNKPLIPLNSVPIPEYTDTDYIKLLDNENPEIVYSAVCQFIGDATKYAKILSSDTIEDSIAYINAKIIYTKIASLLFSDDEWIVCSSLRFFSDFGQKYKNKEEIASKLIRVKLKTKSIKLEYINALQGLYGAKTKPFEKTLKDYVDDDSWLISRYAFSILPYLDNDAFGKQLISHYKNAKEYDKLLIISGLNNNYSDSILSFILSELQTEKNSKIKLYLIKNLDKAQNNKKVTDWFIMNYSNLGSLKEAVTLHLFWNLTETNNTSDVDIVCALINTDLIADSLVTELYTIIYDKLYVEDQGKPSLEIQNLKKIDHLLSTHQKFSNSWMTFKNNQTNFSYDKTFKKQQIELMKEYQWKVSKLYDTNKIDKKHKDKYLKKIQELEEEFE